MAPIQSLPAMFATKATQDMSKFVWPYLHDVNAALPHAQVMPLSLAIGITAPFGVHPVYARPFYVSRRAIIDLHLKGVHPGWYVGLDEGAEFQVFRCSLQILVTPGASMR